MKIATKIAGFLMSCLTLCTALQPVAAMAENTEMARPRSTIDLSRKDRLTGAPTPQDNPSYCPSGQVLSGGVCVLISNQNAKGSWATEPFMFTPEPGVDYKEQVVCVWGMGLAEVANPWGPGKVPAPCPGGSGIVTLRIFNNLSGGGV